MTTTLANRYHAPVQVETEVLDLPVQGALPPELCGDYIRNGPNPRPGTPQAHLFLGDGMLHGIRLESGRARAYRNRWVRTRSFIDDVPYVRPDGTLDLTAAAANTNVIAHGKRLLALVESSFPYEVTRQLETTGPFDFGHRLTTPFTAHPKRCPLTGELHAFGMSIVPGALTYHRIDAAGTLVESRPIPVPGVTMMHDFALTERFAIFMDLPVVFDMPAALRGEFPYRWSDTYGARLGVLERNAPDVPVRWFDIEPCYVFHVLNAFEDGERIVIDVIRYRELWRTGSDGFGPTTLHRWTIDPAAGQVAEAILDDGSSEFPRCDERRAGSAYRYGYVVTGTADRGAAVRKHDLGNHTWAEHVFGPGRAPSEMVFVPRGAAEDDGWLMGYVYDAARDGSDFVVLDARNVSAPPVAVVALPVRVPYGFHGNWIADSET